MSSSTNSQKRENIFALFRIWKIIFTRKMKTISKRMRRGVGTFDPSAASSASSHFGEIVNVIDSFISCDYASLMKLGSLDIDGLCRLCADNDHGGAGPSSDANITCLDGGAGK
ncbi:unnamed protein product [Lactuca virosa]|uniref:Uncharacterized protein n=1 Tax=Lactuca virosa TaxID=75947 RepID=A0AAU9PGE6_9ASTR|nr:unnamed protein product [Lactuca virosa]